MVYEHENFNEMHGTDYVDPLESEKDVDYNCSEHNAFANGEPCVTLDDLELEDADEMRAGRICGANCYWS